jgi:AraC family transcriptional regulator
MARSILSVPVTMGSPAFRTLPLDGFDVIEAWFAPGDQLPQHTHDRTCVAVILEGSFDLRIERRHHHCPPTAVFTEPAGEKHANHIGPAGARVVVVQPYPARTGSPGPFARFLDRTSHQCHAGVAEQAARLAVELTGTDDLAPLAAEAIVLEMLVTLARAGDADVRQIPPWLLRAQELLHARFAEPLRMEEIAREVAVQPAHLARVFQRCFRVPIGAYVRRLRLEWVARQLEQSSEPLACLALAAGFADQSHFTRAFKRYSGLTPSAYRRIRSN